MRTLKGLPSVARAALGEDFRRGEVPAVDVSAYTCDIHFDRPVSLDPLRELIEAAMKKFGNSPPPDSDPWLGPRVHASFRLTRREAADKRLWQYLTVAEFPDYVRWRWGTEASDKAVPLDRFFGEDSKNSLARLWWAAELTRNGADYTRSEIALGISRFIVSWQHLILTHHRPCALAVVDFLAGLQKSGTADSQGQKMAKAVNAVLRTVALDMLVPNPPPDADALREWVNGKVDVTLMMDALPTGPDEQPIPDANIATVRKFLDDLAERINLAGTKPAKVTRAGAEVS